MVRFINLLISIILPAQYGAATIECATMSVLKELC